MRRKPIPKFKSSQEAIEFGRNATVAEVDVIKNIRGMCLRMIERLDIDIKNDIKVLDLKMDFATQAQFMREAIEAARGSNGRR
jgi:hypothetical protein